jgi:hypothetical protein
MNAITSLRFVFPAPSKKAYLASFLQAFLKPIPSLNILEEYQLFERFESRWVKKRQQLINNQMHSYFFKLEITGDELPA